MKPLNEQQLETLATGLHGSAHRLLRSLRGEDRAAGISAPRLSALSVIVFAGPLSLARLAAAEEVSPPTMSRIVEALVRAGLASRDTDAGDRRMVRIVATEAGRTLLTERRARRLRAITARLARLGESEQRALMRGVEILERLPAR